MQLGARFFPALYNVTHKPTQPTASPCTSVVFFGERKEGDGVGVDLFASNQRVFLAAVALLTCCAAVTCPTPKRERACLSQSHLHLSLLL